MTGDPNDPMPSSRPEATSARNQEPVGLNRHSSHSTGVALLLIDVINTMSFEGSQSLVRRALPMARRLAALKAKAARDGVPTIYVNDNFGQWRSDFRATFRNCARRGSPGRRIATLLKPGRRDYFVLKPKHSGFHATALDVLLEYLGARVLVLGGVAANICVLFTANDAYMRDYEVHVPRDCVASNSDRDTRYALRQMSRFLKADLRPSDKIDFDELKARAVLPARASRAGA